MGLIYMSSSRIAICIVVFQFKHTSLVTQEAIEIKEFFSSIFLAYIKGFDREIKLKRQKINKKRK